MVLFQPVPSVPAQQPTTGLVASALTPTDGIRWEDGIAWRSERCPQAAGFDPCGTEFEDPPAGGGGDQINYYRPVAFTVTDECSTRTRDYDVQRVQRQADAVTSWMVARELEQGTITRLNPYESPLSEGDPTATNMFMASTEADVVTGGPFTPLAGLGALEEAARDAQLGMDVWLHVAPRLIPLLENALEREGRLLRTKTGARVVADAGYSGAGPLTAGTSEVQTVTVTGTPTGGTFTLTYAGSTTVPIAYNAAATVVQAALRGLPNLNSGDVSVTGSAGGPYTVTFAADLGNVALMTADGSGLTGGTDPDVTVVQTTPGVNPAPTAGTWMYATGPVVVRLSDVQVLETIVHRENRVEGRASRLFAAYFDPCTLRAVNITVPTPA